MPKWNQDIDGNHLRIASHQGSAMRVLAGPGTGKSYALQRKVMRLLEEGKDPSRILVVTFTNVAADALKKDLAAAQTPGAENVRARTLHSLCFEILRRQQVLEITNRTPRPLMDFETNFLLEDLKGDFNGKRNTEKLLLAYESAFARQQQDTPGVIQSADDARFKTRLLRWLSIHRAMLIGELVPITYDYLRNNPTAQELNQYDYILVDEYQDLNKAEQSLIDLFASNGELLVIGDDDQSIYSFKHAHPDGIIEFPTTHNPLEDISLQICRRCPKKVVRLANELMGYFLGEHPKKLGEHPENGEGEVHAVQWNNIDEETKGTAKIVSAMISDATREVRAEDILILSPRRQLGYALRDELKSSFAINSNTFFQEEALDTEKAKRAYSLLNYIAYPDDRIALRALLGMPTVLQGTYEKILLKAEELNKTPKEVILDIKAGTIAISRSDEIVRRYDDIESVKTSLDGKSVTEIVASLFDRTDPSDIEVLLSIIDTIKIDEEMDLKTFFTKLQDRIRSPEVTNDAGYVRIMSLHKSKGLTSKVVFVIGCVAGLVPTIKDERKLINENQTAELDRLRAEAKRLFFVAITRPKQTLILSSFRDIDFGVAMKLNVRIMGGQRGRSARTQASPFFGEVTQHLPNVVVGSELLRIFGIKS
ncbi:MAG: ATP-dependent helicase [Candidatus Pacebacteria bacterium]|nr:ATP-dependent helicase [Candidatus Paceibacterota bacterium]